MAGPRRSTPRSTFARRSWGWIMADGVIGVVVGFFALVVPGYTVVALALLLGFGLLLQGITQTIAGISTGELSGRGWVIALGVLSLFAGVICIFQPGAGLYAIVVGVTIWFFAAGINELIAAFTLSENQIINGVLGVLTLIAGFIFVVQPGMALGTAAVLAGIFFLLRGVGEILLAVRLRQVA